MPEAAPTPPERDRWMTPQQAAEYVGVSVDYLERLRRAKDGPRWSKVSYRVVRYRRRDLDIWLESLAVGAGGQ